MKNFKAHMINKSDLKRLEAEAINRAIGNTYRVLGASAKHADRELCALVVGVPRHCEPGRAKGSVIPNKGGVIPGGSVFK